MIDDLHKEQTLNQRIKRIPLIDFQQHREGKSSQAYKDAKLNARPGIIYESHRRYTNTNGTVSAESKDIKSSCEG